MKIKKLLKKFYRVWHEDGLMTAIGRITHFVGNKEGRRVRSQDIHNAKNKHGIVLFINGYCIEHPTRYRVIHQMEQLKEAGIDCAKVYLEDIELEMEENYQLFIFYRCEWTEGVAAFIEKAKKNGKKVCFDIDDLVIDTKYTDQVPFVRDLSLESKKIFDESVILVGKTLSLCDIAITTTEALAEKLREVVPKTYVNRNTASKEMVALSEAAYAGCKRDKKRVWLGYFSGSLTHNKDFEIIRPTLMRVLDEYPHAGLILGGELEVSDELEKFGDRVIRRDAVSWQQLPQLIIQSDINLAPLQNTIFNRSKSEIKWIEAALVRVPTVASKTGAFESMINHGETGVLCENTDDAWYDNICKVVNDEKYRWHIAHSAYEYVIKNCTTVGKAQAYAEFVQRLVPDKDNNANAGVKHE